MNKPLVNFKYIYGPVFSWRLGRSLGIDPISMGEKVCSFDCSYCQIGNTGRFSNKREIFAPTKEIIKEIKSLPPVEIDYITFSGRGESTLAKNLGEMIRAIKSIRPEKIAVITNSSLIERRDVQKDLMLADFVMAKLDASSEKEFVKINKPMQGLKVNNIVRGIKEFRAGYKGKLALQIMFIDDNKACAEDLARIAKEIGPDEIQINTPLRPCSVKPLSKEEMDTIKKYFKGMNVKFVYDVEKKGLEPINKNDTVKRRGRKLDYVEE